jgi:phage-related protein
VAKLDLAVDVNVSGAEKLNNLGKSIAGGALQVALFGAIAGGAIAAVGVATANFASDQNEALSKVNVVFGKSAKEVTEWAETSAESMGLSETAALGAAGTFGNLFKAMGIGDKPALDMSQNVTQLAADLASFNNIGTDEALEKIRAGLVGEAEPLRTLGVNISAVRTEAKALALGFKKVDGQFSASAKAQANYALILEDTKLAQGDFARTSDGMANQQRILAATFEDSMADIGQAFVPIIEEILPVATDLLKGFAAFIVDSMPTIKAVIGGVATAFGAAFSFIADEIIPRVAAVFASFGGPGGAGDIFASVFQTISGLVDFFAKNVIPFAIDVFNTLVEFIKANGPTIGSIVSQAFGAISEVVKTVGPIIMEVAKVIFPAVLTAAGILLTGLDKTFKLIGGIFEVTGNVVKTMVQGITAAWQLLLTVTTFIWNGIAGIIRGVINGVIDILNGFFGFLNGFQIGIPAIDVGPVHIGGGVIDPFNIGLIPHLAAGGIIKHPTLALLGENGPEAVVPLSGNPKTGGDFHSHITILGQDPFIRNEEDLVRVQQRIAFLEGF